VADIERTVVWSALQGNELGTLIDRGIEPEHFADDEVRDVYEWAYSFYAEHHQPPSMEAVKAVYPHFKARISKDPLKFHMERFIVKVNERMATALLRDYFEIMEDPECIPNIAEYAMDMATQLIEVVPQPRAVYLGKDAMKSYHRYKERQKTGDLPGMPIGVPSYDALMLGMQPHELLVYAGPPGSGKTTSMQHTSKVVYLDGGSVLFISLEVEGEQILRRFQTMLAKIEYHALKGLSLIPEQEQAWLKILERCQKEAQDHDIIIRDDIMNCTAEKVATQRVRYKPDLVVVDYLEEMRGRKGLSGWENVQENARQMKQQARVSKVPVITGTQINVSTGETSHQSIRKVADTIIQLVPHDPEDDKSDVAEGEMGYVLLKYRDGPSRKRTKMKWELDRMDIEELGAASNFPARPLAERKRLNRLAKKNGQAKHSDNPYSRKRGSHLKDQGVNPWARSRRA
jgi:replicative DNA helicase